MLRPAPRPQRLLGTTEAFETPMGTLYLTLNMLDGTPFEMFAQIGKAGSDVKAFTEAIARLVSLALRSGIDPEEVAHQLTGIGGSRSVGFGPDRVHSVPDAIGRFLLSGGRCGDTDLNRRPDDRARTAGDGRRTCTFDDSDCEVG